MSLTAEQTAVVTADDPLLKVNAVAGSGKTTTLLAFAARRPKSQILYLAYNRSVADEVKTKAQAQGLNNLHIHTIHGLAYRYANGKTYQLEGDMSELRLLEHYVPASDRDTERGMLLAWTLKDLINYYLNSELVPLDADLLAFYEAATVPTEQVRKLLETRGEELLSLVREILADMKNRRIPALHDFYLKMFQFARVKLPYDIILVDEAQDTSGVMLTIVQRQEHAQRVFVGDSFQQIYAFRHAVNSLDRVSGRSLHLSQTFRFGDGLAKHIAQRVNEGYALLGQQPGFVMRGTDHDTRFGTRAAENQYPLAVIARSNLALFEAVLSHLFTGERSLQFEGGYGAYSFMNARVAGLLYLLDGKKDKISDPLIRKFQTLQEAEGYAEDTQNNALRTLIDLVKRYGTKLYDFDKLIKARLVEKEKADILFTTTHRAKGQEYDTVEMVEDDFTTRSQLANLLASEADTLNPVKLREEINVWYVASTRARHSVRLAAF